MSTPSDFADVPVNRFLGLVLRSHSAERVGRKLAVCECEVFQGEHRIAKGTFSFLFLDRATS